MNYENKKDELNALMDLELARKEAAITDNSELEASIEESAGMRMGMSNYLVIIAVTALTIMGLIAILTLILS